ncbi:MAG: hypothetical protein AVDCRST_MAG10-1715, partial [uncultured Acidimicrobiales bacterium]
GGALGSMGSLGAADPCRRPGPDGGPPPGGHVPALLVRGAGQGRAGGPGPGPDVGGDRRGRGHHPAGGLAEVLQGGAGQSEQGGHQGHAPPAGPPRTL